MAVDRFRLYLQNLQYFEIFRLFIREITRFHHPTTVLSVLPNSLTTAVIFSISSGQMSVGDNQNTCHESIQIYSDLWLLKGMLKPTWTMCKTEINHAPFALEIIGGPFHTIWI